MFLAFRKRLDREDKGFTLIELLVVVIIIGILAAIAIPAFLNQRERARRAAVQSDLRNAAVQAETFFTDGGTYDGFENSTLFTSIDGANEGTPGVTLSITPAHTTLTSFCIVGAHGGLPTGEVWSYRNDRSPQLNNATCP